MGHERQTNRTPNETATALERRLLEDATAFQRDLGRESLTQAVGLDEVRKGGNTDLFLALGFGELVEHDRARYGKTLRDIAEWTGTSMTRCAARLRLYLAFRRGLIDPDMTVRTAEIAAGMRDVGGAYIGVWMALDTTITKGEAL